MMLPTVLDGVSSDAQFSGPLGDCQLLAIPLNPVRDSSVAVLLEHVSPFAVPRKVARIVVAALKGLSRRARPHVGQERKEVIPARVEAQSASAVAWKLLMVGVRATRTKLSPRAVFLGLTQPVLGVDLRQRFAQLAAARLRAATQVAPSDAVNIAAFAATFPPNLFRFPGWRINAPENRQSSEYVSGKVERGSAHIAHIISFW
jgi:hypothetical protein